MFRLSVLVFLCFTTCGCLGLYTFDDGHCIFGGYCGLDPDHPNSTRHRLNCHYPGPPGVASRAQADIVTELCPHLLPDDGAEMKLCCDITSLEELKTKVNISKSLVGD